MRIIKRNIGAILTFFLTVILTLIIFYESGIFKGSILISDLNAEYQPLLMQVRRILTGNIGIYNFNTGMGDNFTGTYFYYMSSPLNVLSLFIKDINKLVIVLVTLKLGLTSFFSYKYFRYQVKEEKIKYLSVVSILYALSSFSLSYYLHIMWLDIYMLFPLLLLGIDKIIKERKHLIYIISMILIIFCNYYFAYMVCIFSFIYFNYKLFINKEMKNKRLRENIHFIIVSGLAIGGASLVLLPIASEINTYSRQNGNLFGGEDINFSFNIVNYVKTYILGNVKDIDILNEHNFYLYTSIIVFPLLYIYFICKKISVREKIFSGIIILLLILSISCNYLNYAWHGFVPPSFFNGRYTFMFILFILMLCLKGLYNLDDIKAHHFFIIAALILGPVAFLLTFNLSFGLTADDLVKLCLLIMYLFLLKLIPNNKYLEAILMAAIIYEVNINAYTYLRRYHFDAPTKDDIYENSIKYIKEKDNNVFYRIEDDNSNTDNYSILYNYYSIDYFMSTVKKDLINFFINLDVGNHAYTKNTISYDGRYHLISSLLNIKYYIETKSLTNEYYNKLETINDSYEVYENPYSLNLGYMVKKDIINTKLDNNGLENINNIYIGMTGKNVLNQQEVEKIDDRNYKFVNYRNKNFYLLVKLKGWYSYSDLSVSINDKTLDNTGNTFYYFVKNEYKEDDTIDITLSAGDGTIGDIEGVYVYYIDEDNFRENIELLKKNQLTVTSVKRDTIKGFITSDEDGILFTSIPYDKNLTIYVDGKKQKTVKLLDTFMGIELKDGLHEIKIEYKPRNIYYAIIPSILSLSILWVYLKYICKRIIKTESK